MKKLVFLSSLVLAATVVAAPVAFAQTPAQPSCAEAIAAMNQAQTAHAAAVAADKAAAAAKAADKALAEAEAALDAHKLVASDGSTVDLSRLEELRAKANNPDDPDRVLAAEKVALIEAHLKLEADGRAALVEAEKTDAAALQAEANKTNADDLEAAAATAKLVADEACRGPQGEPGQNGGSNDNGSGGGSGSGGNAVDTGGDFDQVGSVPVGGVATGGGPA